VAAVARKAAVRAAARVQAEAAKDRWAVVKLAVVERWAAVKAAADRWGRQDRVAVRPAARAAKLVELVERVDIPAPAALAEEAEARLAAPAVPAEAVVGR
jgi:hypothetical protein